MHRVLGLIDHLPLHGQGGDVVALAAAGRQRRLHQRGHRILHGLAAQVIDDDRLFEHIPQAIRAQQQPIAVLQRMRAGNGKHGRDLGAQAGVEHVAVEKALRQLHGADALHFGVGMVACARLQLPVAHPVQARVAAMDPIRLALLHQRSHQRGARRIGHALVACVGQDALVRHQQRIAQKNWGIEQRGLGQTLKLGRHGLQCQLGRNFTFGMPAHTIGQHEQCRFARVAIAHPVFVVGTATTAAELEDRKFHGVFRGGATEVEGATGSAAALGWPMSAPSCKRTRSAIVSWV